MKISSPKAINWTLKQYGYINVHIMLSPEGLVDPKVLAKNFGF
jgi:hypothetical protein